MENLVFTESVAANGRGNAVRFATSRLGWRAAIFVVGMITVPALTGWTTGQITLPARQPQRQNMSPQNQSSTAPSTKSHSCPCGCNGTCCSGNCGAAVVLTLQVESGNPGIVHASRAPGTTPALQPGWNDLVNFTPCPPDPTNSLDTNASPEKPGEDTDKPVATANLVRFADLPTNAICNLTNGPPGEHWVKTSGNVATQIATSRPQKMATNEMVEFVLQATNFINVPLNGTFYFLVDANQEQPWIKLSPTNAANVKSWQRAAVRPGLVTVGPTNLAAQH